MGFTDWLLDKTLGWIGSWRRSRRWEEHLVNDLLRIRGELWWPIHLHSRLEPGDGVEEATIWFFEFPHSLRDHTHRLLDEAPSSAPVGIPG